MTFFKNGQGLVQKVIHLVHQAPFLTRVVLRRHEVLVVAREPGADVELDGRDFVVPGPARLLVERHGAAQLPRGVEPGAQSIPGRQRDRGQVQHAVVGVDRVPADQGPQVQSPATPQRMQDGDVAAEHHAPLVTVVEDAGDKAQERAPLGGGEVHLRTHGPGQDHASIGHRHGQRPDPEARLVVLLRGEPDVRLGLGLVLRLGLGLGLGLLVLVRDRPTLGTANDLAGALALVVLQGERARLRVAVEARPSLGRAGGGGVVGASRVEVDRQHHADDREHDDVAHRSLLVALDGSTAG